MQLAPERVILEPWTGGRIGPVVHLKKFRRLGDELTTSTGVESVLRLAESALEEGQEILVRLLHVHAEDRAQRCESDLLF